MCPWDPNLRELRAECYIAVGDYFKAIGDIRPTTKLRADNTAGYYKLSLLHYDIGEADESLRYVHLHHDVNLLPSGSEQHEVLLFGSIQEGILQAPH